MSISIFIHAAVELEGEAETLHAVRQVAERVLPGEQLMIAVAPDPHIPWTRLLARLEVYLGDGPDPYNLKSIAGRLHDALVEACQVHVHVDVIRLDHLVAPHSATVRSDMEAPA